MSNRPASLGKCCVAELIGTLWLVLFGCGAVHVAVLDGSLSGLWQVAVVWGLAIMTAIFLFGGISGAHINPAITVGLAVWGRFPKRFVLPYMASQFTGAFLAAAMLYTAFSPHLAKKESQLGLIRGQMGSEITAGCYGEYFPNPGLLAATRPASSVEAYEFWQSHVSWPVAFGAEFVGTLVLAWVVCAVTNPHNPTAPPSQMAPVFIGLTVSMLICVIAPLTQACFNPARDFGPRLFARLAGWGDVALPLNVKLLPFLAVYAAAPILGSIVGIGLHRTFTAYEPSEKPHTKESAS